MAKSKKKSYSTVPAWLLVGGLGAAALWFLFGGSKAHAAEPDAVLPPPEEGWPAAAVAANGAGVPTGADALDTGSGTVTYTDGGAGGTTTTTDGGAGGTSYTPPKAYSYSQTRQPLKAQTKKVDVFAPALESIRKQQLAFKPAATIPKPLPAAQDTRPKIGGSPGKTPKNWGRVGQWGGSPSRWV